MDYDALQAAMKACMVAATGLTADRVLFDYAAYQGGARPVDGPFLTMRIGPTIPVGAIDGLVTIIHDDGKPGEEVEIATQATREFTWTVQMFGGTPMGNGSPVARLSRARERLRLPSVRSLLSAVGVSPFGPGSVRFIPQIEGTKFEARAVMDVRCYGDFSTSEFCTYIETVRLTDEFVTPHTTTDYPLTGG